jgi:hypothetical protein
MTESCARPRILDQVRLDGIPALDGYLNTHLRQFGKFTGVFMGQKSIYR